MDQAGGSSQPGSTMGMPWEGTAEGAGAPMPPIFGNASGSSSGDMDFKGINLDDVFSGVFFSPEGELLDMASDDEGGKSPNITLSSIDGTGPQFGQYAVLGGSCGDGINPTPDSSTPLVKVEGQPDPSALAASGDAGAGAEPSTGGVTGLPPQTNHFGGAGGTVGAETASTAVAPMEQGTAVRGTAAATAERAAMAAAAAAAAAAAEARVAQETAVSKAAAAVKAAAAHAQAQARIKQGSINPPNPVATTGAGLASSSARGLPADTSARIGGAGWGLGSGGGVTPGATPGAAGIRPAGVAFGSRGMGSGSAPRRQRHKVSSKDLTEEQRIERRERNREHAKRSRVRKKFLLDSLQRSVDALQAENDSLKGSIVSSLGDRGRVLVAKCAPEDAGGLVTANPTQATKILDDPDYSLVKALQTAQQNFVITDASLPDNPIVFASSGFLELTGYKLTEVLGRNCRFLQGPETDPRAVDKIRKAIEEGADASVCLLNYRADETTFWNQFFVAALRDGEGTTVNYVGVQCKVGDDYARIVVNEQNRQLGTPAPARRGAAAAPPPVRARTASNSASEAGGGAGASGTGVAQA